MEYRIERVEHMAQRPKWFVKFLLDLRLMKYFKPGTLETAMQYLREIEKSMVQTISKSQIYYIEKGENTISINSSRTHKPFVEFKVSPIGE